MMKKLLAVLVIGLSTSAFHAALAHGGAQAKHGGVVALASDLSFELVALPSGAVVHVEDHGKPMPLTGISGKLTVLNGAEKSESALAVVGAMLQAKGLLIQPGARVVAVLNMADKKTITVRFKLK